LKENEKAQVQKTNRRIVLVFIPRLNYFLFCKVWAGLSVIRVLIIFWYGRLTWRLAPFVATRRALLLPQNLI